MIESIKHILFQLLLCLDQTANVLIWIKGDGFGYADETLSARAWRLRDQSNCWKRIDKLFFWENFHCKTAYESEKQRKHLPTTYRENHETPTD